MNSRMHHQRGSASAEYVVILMFSIAILFLPLPGDTGSVVDMVVNAFKQFQAHSLYLLSMP